MTNAFEKIVTAYFNNIDVVSTKIKFVKEYHDQILNELFIDKKHQIYTDINLIFIELSGFLIKNNKKEYNFVYDQVVSVAEQLSTKIISAYLNDNLVNNNWLDARKYVKTDANYREAKVNWNVTAENIAKLKNDKNLIITQGFIASDNNNNSTTLGREGSDYTAAIFAYCLDAKSLTVFKDVDGVLNADPKVFKNTKLLNQISYREAIEMAFYGASVIHPKTLQPLQNKEIPLFVKSFKKPTNIGTVIGKGVDLKPKTPCFIIKNKQLLLSVSTKDFSFMMENNISEIFELLHRYKLRVNLIQNTAISFSVCLEDKFSKFDSFLEELTLKYKALYNKDVSLLTIRHFDKKSINKTEQENKILLKQTSRETVQFVLKTKKK